MRIWFFGQVVSNLKFLACLNFLNFMFFWAYDCLSIHWMTCHQFVVHCLWMLFLIDTVKSGCLNMCCVVSKLKICVHQNQAFKAFWQVWPVLIIFAIPTNFCHQLQQCVEPTIFVIPFLSPLRHYGIHHSGKKHHCWTHHRLTFKKPTKLEWMLFFRTKLNLWLL